MNKIKQFIISMFGVVALAASPVAAGLLITYLGRSAIDLSLIISLPLFLLWAGFQILSYKED